MATISNPAKALQQNRPRPAVPRSVVPAIPLPYIQKRQQQQQQQQAQLARAREEAAAKAEIEAASSPTPPTVTPETTNGSLEEQTAVKADESGGQASPSTPATPITPALEETPALGNGVPIEALKEDATATSEHEKIASDAPSDVQSSASRSTYHMPPPFVPANSNHFNGMHPEAARFPPQNGFNGNHQMHHPHPSTGSVMFGGYPESNKSSPAPPSGGNMPQYGFQPPPHGVGRHVPHPSNSGHSQHMSNGYAPMGPPAPPGYYPRTGPDNLNLINQGQNGDIYARRYLGSYNNIPDLYPPGPNVNGYDPSTPHSFHGSQSSTHEQESGPAFWSQYPTAVISNGSNGHIEEVRLYQQPVPKPRDGPQAVTVPPNVFLSQPSSRPPHMDQMDGLIAWLRESFADPTFTDYVVELRYTDDRAPPVRIPGHSLMLARSNKLKDMMLAQAQSDGVLARSLLIESDDRFLNSDGFWMAMQRLYGLPLLDLNSIGILSVRHAQYTAPLTGTPASRFDLALGYAAAGHFLRIHSVIARGCEIASSLISWETIEKAFDFSLDGGLDSQWTLERPADNEPTPSTYGPCVNMVVHGALQFLIASFPAAFKLDTSVGEAAFHHRLPFIEDIRATVPNPRLSTIRFGDHPNEESRNSTSEDLVTTTLSKVLLALPFHLLKYVLESSRLGNVQGWATTTLRQEVMHSVVQEREKRRVKVLENSSVSNSNRNLQVKLWDSVGWQEVVEPLGGNEATPALSRSWVGFELPTGN